MKLERPNSFSARASEHLLHPNNDPRKGDEILIVTRGEGSRVTDEAGKTYIEGVAGLWCASLGFSNQRLADAATRQLGILPYYQTTSYKSHPVVIELADKLLSVAPPNMAKALFANSGSEANDTAVKLIWYYNNALGRPEKKKIISRANGYHGSTVVAASLTGIAANHLNFDLPIDRIFHTCEPHYYRDALPGESEEDFSTRCAAELEELILREGPDTVAAMFMEPVTGAGGVVFPPRGYVEKIQAVLRRHDVLLVVDEIICGFGRLGEYWGHQAVGLTPDMITCAKALSAGYLPISALLISGPIIDAISEQAHQAGAFAHSVTYFGHPVSSAVALEALNIYEEMDVAANNRRLGKILHDGLRRRLGDHPVVGEIRGLGLLAALDFRIGKDRWKRFDPALKFAYRVHDLCLEGGLILRPMSPEVIAICPPYIITEAEIAELIEILAAAIGKAAAEVTTPAA